MNSQIDWHERDRCYPGGTCYNTVWEPRPYGDYVYLQKPVITPVYTVPLVLLQMRKCAFHLWERAQGVPLKGYNATEYSPGSYGKPCAIGTRNNDGK